MKIEYAPAAPADLTTISLLALASEDKAVRAAEIDRLRQCCETVGFFYLKDHGVSKPLLERCWNSAKTFFKKPESVKAKWGHDAQEIYPSDIRGFSAAEQFNPETEIDRKQFFDFGVDHPLVPGRAFTGITSVPSEEDAPDFVTAHQEVLDIAMDSVTPILSRALALALGQKEDFFTKNMSADEILVIQRTLIYPPSGGHAGRHCDSCLFTLLLQEEQKSERSSLKLFSQGKWQDVRPLPELMVVNLGDMLQMWSNHRFVSTPHQVVHVENKERHSMPIFVYPNPETNIVPIGLTESEGTIGTELMLKNFKRLWVGKTGQGLLRKTQCEGSNTDCKCWRCM